MMAALAVLTDLWMLIRHALGWGEGIRRRIDPSLWNRGHCCCHRHHHHHYLFQPTKTIYSPPSVPFHSLPLGKMKKAAFHIDTFRPWNPSRTEPVPSRKPSSPLRYPTPACTISSPSHDGASVRISRTIPDRGTEQHPLAARLPAEVCVHSVQPSPPLNPCHRSRKESLSGPSSLPAGNSASVTAVGTSRIQIQTQTRRVSPSLPLSPGTDSPPDFRDATNGSIESPPFIQSAVADALSGDSRSCFDQLFILPDKPLDEWSAIPIDPIILDDKGFLEGSEVHSAAHVSGSIGPICQEQQAYLYPESPLLLQDTCSRHFSSNDRSTSQDRSSDTTDCTPSDQHNQPMHLSNGRQRSDVIDLEGHGQQVHGVDTGQSQCRKRSSGGTENSEGQPSKWPRITTVSQPTENSFMTICSHFLSLQTDERLQFLSWLFEGALPRCTSDPECAMSDPPKTCDIGGGNVRRSPRHYHRCTQPDKGATPESGGGKNSQK